MRHITHYCYLCFLPVKHKKNGICSSCLRQIIHTSIDLNSCQKCGLPINKHICETLKPAWQKMVYVGEYKNPLSTLVLRLKFSREFYLANTLARLILLAWFKNYQHGVINRPTRLISVPLHPLRFWWRGFNQTDLLTKPLAKWLDCKYSPDTLLRKRYTPKQSSLTAEAREKNLKNAFHLTESIKGEHIALIDDVITTGSTIQEISELLIAEGAASIQVWAVCRTL